MLPLMVDATYHMNRLCMNMSDIRNRDLIHVVLCAYMVGYMTQFFFSLHFFIELVVRLYHKCGTDALNLLPNHSYPNPLHNYHPYTFEQVCHKCWCKSMLICLGASLKLNMAPTRKENTPSSQQKYCRYISLTSRSCWLPLLVLTTGTVKPSIIGDA